MAVYGKERETGRDERERGGIVRGEKAGRKGKQWKGWGGGGGRGTTHKQVTVREDEPVADPGPIRHNLVTA